MIGDQIIYFTRVTQSQVVKELPFFVELYTVRISQLNKIINKWPFHGISLHWKEELDIYCPVTRVKEEKDWCVVMTHLLLWGFEILKLGEKR